MGRLIRRACLGGWLWFGLLVVGTLLLAPAGADAFVYWANTGNGPFSAYGGGPYELGWQREAGDGTTIGRANNNGSDATQNFVTGLSGPCGLASNGTDLYWTEGGATGTTGAVQVPTGDADTGFHPDSAEFGCGIAADASSLYWSTQDEQTPVEKAGLTGSSPSSLVPQTAASTLPCGIARSGAYVYWVDNFGGTEFIARAKTDGTDVEPEWGIGFPDTNFCGLAIANGTLYAALTNGFIQDQSGVYYYNVSGYIYGYSLSDPTQRTQFIDDGDGVCGLATDGTKLYWANYANGTIQSKPLAGGPETTIATGADSPCGVAVDSLTSSDVPGKPTVTNILPESVATTTATLGAYVDPNGGQTTYHFAFQASGGPEIDTPNPDGSIQGADYVAHTLKAPITQLQPNTTYTWWVVATNQYGTTTGPQQTFTTVDPYTIPAKQSVSLTASSASPKPGDTITCHADYTADPGDQIRYDFELIRNGQSLESIGPGGDNSITFFIATDDYNATYQCRVAAEDTAGSSAPALSNTVHVPDFVNPYFGDEFAFPAFDAQVAFGDLMSVYTQPQIIFPGGLPTLLSWTIWSGDYAGRQTYSEFGQALEDARLVDGQDAVSKYPHSSAGNTVHALAAAGGPSTALRNRIDALDTLWYSRAFHLAWTQQAEDEIQESQGAGIGDALAGNVKQVLAHHRTPIIVMANGTSTYVVAVYKFVGADSSGNDSFIVYDPHAPDRADSQTVLTVGRNSWSYRGLNPTAVSDQKTNSDWKCSPDNSGGADCHYGNVTDTETNTAPIAVMDPGSFSDPQLQTVPELNAYRQVAQLGPSNTFDGVPAGPDGENAPNGGFTCVVWDYYGDECECDLYDWESNPNLRWCGTLINGDEAPDPEHSRPTGYLLSDGSQTGPPTSDVTQITTASGKTMLINGSSAAIPAKNGLLGSVIPAQSPGGRPLIELPADAGPFTVTLRNTGTGPVEEDVSSGGDNFAVGVNATTNGDEQAIVGQNDIGLSATQAGQPMTISDSDQTGTRATVTGNTTANGTVTLGTTGNQVQISHAGAATSVNLTVSSRTADTFTTGPIALAKDGSATVSGLSSGLAGGKVRIKAGGHTRMVRVRTSHLASISKLVAKQVGTAKVRLSLTRGAAKLPEGAKVNVALALLRGRKNAVATSTKNLAAGSRTATVTVKVPKRRERYTVVGRVTVVASGPTGPTTTTATKSLTFTG